MATNRGKLPILLFGDTVDFSTWTSEGSPIITSGQTDPLGGTNAYLLEDDTASASESIKKTGTTLLSSRLLFAIFVKQGTATQNAVRLLDNDGGGPDNTYVSINWSGGVPSLQNEGAGSPTLFPPINVGNSWWLIRIGSDLADAGETWAFRLQPAGVGNAKTGTCYFYGRSVVLMGLHLDDARSWDEPREGSEWVKAPSGVEDAWIVARDYMLEGDVRWIPTVDEAAPHNRTGWDGRREHALINSGWSSLLDFASSLRATIVFVPDRDDASKFHNTYIQAPRDESNRRPDLEQDTTRRFTLILRDSDDVPFEGY